MANDPNKSGNKNPQNGLADPDSILAKIQQREREAGRQTVREIQLGSTLEPRELAVGELQSILDVAAGSPAEKILREQISRDQNYLNKAYNSIDVGERSRRERSERLLARDIQRQYGTSAVRGEVLRSSASTKNVMAGIGMVDVPYSQLESQKATSEMNIAGYAREAINHTSGMYAHEGTADPIRAAAITELEKKIRSEQNNLGGIEAGLRYKKSMGMDPQSQLGELFKSGSRATDVLMSGGGGALGDAAEKLTRALKDLQAETDTTSKSFRELEEKAQESAEEFEKMHDAAGGGGGRATNAQLFQGAAGGFQAAAQANQAIEVTQRLQQMSNISGLASIENQKYSAYRKASAGDVMSQMQLGQYAAAEDFGKEIAQGQRDTLDFQLGGGVFQTTAGGIMAMEGGAQKNPLSEVVAGAMGNAGNASQETLQGTLNAAQGVAISTTVGFDMARQVSQTQARVAAVNQFMGASQAINQVPAEQMQGFRDFSVGLGATARSLGGGGAAFINKSMEFAKGKYNGQGGQTSVLTEARLSPEEFNKMSQLGAATMGSMFNTDQIFAARNLERSGYGTKEENMQRMATLAAAGSNNPQAGLGSVLESAVSKGMDTSKAISALVDHSASMAASSVGRSLGIDTAGASAAMLAAMMTGPNKEASLARAADLQGAIRGISTNVDASFSGFVATSRISRDLGVDGTEAIRLQRVDTDTLRSLDTPTKRAEFFKERNVNTTGKDTGMMVSNLLDDRAATILEGGGIGFTETGRDALLKRIKESGGKMTIKGLTQQEQNILGTGLTSDTYNTITEALNAVNAVYAGPSAKDQNKSHSILAGKGGSKEQQEEDALLTQSAKQLAAAAAEATKTFKTAHETFRELAKMAKSIEKLTDTGYEGSAKTAAATSAATFGDGATKIDLAGKNMLDAALLMKNAITGQSSKNNHVDAPKNIRDIVPNYKLGANPKSGNSISGYKH